MSDREKILANIRRSLGVNRGMLEREAAQNGYGEPELSGPFLPSDETPVEQLTRELEALTVHVHRCDGPDAALAKIGSLLESHKVETALHWDADALPLPGVDGVLRDLGIQSADTRLLGAADRMQRLQALEPVLMCISGVDAAIAESGSLVVLTGPGRPRMASLLPPVHLAILPVDRVVRTLPEAFALLYETHGRDVINQRANTTVITGPSRTADIEQSLTLGVHGPKEIHVVIVG